MTVLREPKSGELTVVTTSTGYSAELDTKGYDVLNLFFIRNAEVGDVGITPQVSPVAEGDDWYDQAAEATYAEDVAVTLVVDPLVAKRFRLFVSTALASSTLGCKYVMTTLNAGSGAL